MKKKQRVKSTFRERFQRYFPRFKDNPWFYINLIYFSVAVPLTLKLGGWWWLTMLPLGIILIHFIYFYITGRLYVNNLRYKNILYFGFRRTGKDLSTQLLIIKRYKKKYNKIVKKKKLDTTAKINAYFNEHPLYLSLYNYGYGARIVPLNDFQLINEETKKSVTYDEFIKGAKISCKKKELYEGLDFYLGEAHLSLPNTEHNKLDKEFPWLPVFISLSGHLYNMNVIINSQEFARSWVKIRNQQDSYVRSIKTFPVGKSWLARNRKWFPFINKNIYTRVRIYQEMQSAENNVLPFKALGAVNEGVKTVYLTSGQATKEQFDATNGKINEYWIKTKLSDIRYDSRVFHTFIFGKQAPTK